MKSVALSMENRVLISQCWLATSFWSRFKGLMGRKGLPADEAIFFPKCNSIHTFFMRFPIDVVFLAADGSVVEVIEALGAWRMLAPRKSVKHTVELKAARARDLGIAPGKRLVWG